MDIKGTSSRLEVFNFIKKETLAQVFSCEFCEISKNTFLSRTPPVAASVKVQSYKLHNNKYMIASTQITNTEIFAFIGVLVFKLLSRKVLFINRKPLKSRLLSRK